MTPTCFYCKKPVEPNSPLTYRRTSGWERKAIGGTRKSGSDIVLREKQPEFACAGCIESKKLGVSSGQGRLGI